MPTEQIETIINPQRIAFAIKISGITVDSLAKSLNVSSSTIKEWSDGITQMPYKYLRKLSGLLKRPTYYFLIDEEPNENFPNAFRKILEFRMDRNQTSPEFSLAIRRSRYIQSEFIDLSAINSANGLSANPDFLNRNGEINTEKVLRYLQVKELPAKVRSADKIFRKWKQAIESKNILITQFLYDIELARGFCIQDSMVPLININSADSLKAKSFTLLHELGHIILGKNNISDKYDYLETSSGEEAICNRFAASILVPHKQLEETLKTVSNNYFKEVPVLANKFGVSRHVIILALARDNHISSDTKEMLLDALELEYREYRDSKKQEKKNVPFQIPFKTTRIASLGSKYVHLVQEKLHKQEISIPEAYQLISLDWHLGEKTFDKFMNL